MHSNPVWRGIEHRLYLFFFRNVECETEWGDWTGQQPNPFEDLYSFYSSIPFLNSRRKNDPHIRVLAGFSGPDAIKYSTKKQLNVKGFEGHRKRCKSAVFW
jgi:hypothetical protein